MGVYQCVPNCDIEIRTFVHLLTKPLDERWPSAKPDADQFEVFCLREFRRESVASA